MAGTNTPIRGLYKPAYNEVGWDQLVNANFDNLDATANKSYVDSQDTAEATARANADTGLQTQINGKQATLTGSGLARNTGACTELSGDVTTSGSNVATVAKIGGSAPAAIATSGKWSDLQNASAALTLANGANGTEFDQLSAALWKWYNTTAATNATTNGSPILDLSANYWTGAASAEDKWTLQSSLGAGTNGASTLAFAHSGSTGLAIVAMPRTQLTGSTFHWYRGANLPADIYTNAEGSGDAIAIAGGPLILMGSGGRLSWSSSTGNLNQASGGADTAITRLAAASLAIGNGTTGDFSGALTLGALTQSNPTAATNATTNASPVQTYSANYWNGTTSAPDTWTVQSSLAAGTNGVSTLTFAHSGSSGLATVQAPAFTPTTPPPSSGGFGLYGNTQNLALVGNTSSTFLLEVCSGGTSLVKWAIGVTAGHYCAAHTSDVALVWANSTTNPNPSGTDTSLSRLSAGVLAIGKTATAGDASGALSLTTVLMAASAGAPTSAATAGTAGQIIYFGGNIYLCTVTGAAGSATWNKLNLTAV